MENNIFNKKPSTKKRIKRLAIYTGAAVLVTGGIVLCANSCGKDTDKKTMEAEVTTSTAVTTTVEPKEFITTEATKKTSANEVTTTEVAYDDDDMTYVIEEDDKMLLISNDDDMIATNDKVDYEATITAPKDELITKLLSSKDEKHVYTEEDVIERSELLAEYVNKYATLSHSNYKFSEFTAKDMYAPVYLANIDHTDSEQTAKMIADGIIDENIEVIVANSFYFFELYADDSINKVMEGKSDIMDLGLLMGYEKDRETAGIMNNMITGFINNDAELNKANYMDTVFYYAEGVTLNKGNYNYGDSVYTTDRDRLAVGSDYTLSYAASVIDELAKMAGVATKEYSDVMYAGRVDFSNLVNVYRGCMEESNSKTYVK